MSDEKRLLRCSVGSSIGNFPRKEAAAFLRQIAASLGPRDNLLLGVDECEDAEKVYSAYNDSEGYVLNRPVTVRC